MRKAVIRVWSPKDPAAVAETVRAYLPLSGNYKVAGVKDGEVFIEGEDYAGWTLEKYVIPRLASGNIYAREMLPLDPGKLNGLMETGHVVRVHPDGSVTEPPAAYAPEVNVELDKDGQIVGAAEKNMADAVEAAGWELMTGYTRQYMAGRSPIMHPSEYIGGQLAADILEQPGLYVAVEVSGLWPSEKAEREGSDDPVGWVVARKLDES